MFGHQNDQDQQRDQDTPDVPAPISDTMTDNTSGAAAADPSPTDTVSIDDPGSSDTSATIASDSDMPAMAPADSSVPSTDNPNWQHPGTPLDSSQLSSDVISPAGGYPKAPSFPPGASHDPASPPPDAPALSPVDESTTHELIEIKQEALTELSPLVDELDQTPEERFRTLMMMIQASDNQHLVKDAYAAAHSIEDEKVRAQALLDIINEVNYFTTPHQA